MRSGQHVGPIYCRALSLVYRRRIPVLEMRVPLRVDDEPPALLAIHPDLQQAAVDPLHGTERTILDPEAALVLEEVQSIAGSKFACPPFRLDHFPLPQLAGVLP